MCERQSSASAGHCAGDGVVLVIIDGLSDVCLGDGRGGVLSRAKTPTLSALTARGQCGLLDPVSPGLTCGSDTAHLALFGYEPRGLYRGRGAFEAIGDGIDMRQGDIAFKSSFASLSGSPKDDPFGFYGNARKETKMNQNANDSPTVVSRKVEGPSLREEIVALCRVLDGTRLPSFPEVQVTVQYAMKHRCGVRLRGKHFSDMVSDTDPRVAGEPLGRSVPLDGADAEPDGSRRAEYSAAVVNEVSDVFRQILATHEVNRDRVLRQGLPPANVLLLRGASEHIHVAEPFEARHGLSAFLIAPTKIIAGVGVTVGLPIVFAPGATGDYQTDYNSKADTCVHTMLTKSDVASDRWRYDVGIVHVKAVDDAVRVRRVSPPTRCVANRANGSAHVRKHEIRRSESACVSPVEQRSDTHYLRRLHVGVAVRRRARARDGQPMLTFRATGPRRRLRQEAHSSRGCGRHDFADRRRSTVLSASWCPHNGNRGSLHSHQPC